MADAFVSCPLLNSILIRKQLYENVLIITIVPSWSLGCPWALIQWMYLADYCIQWIHLVNLYVRYIKPELPVVDPQHRFLHFAKTFALRYYPPSFLQQTFWFITYPSFITHPSFITDPPFITHPLFNTQPSSIAQSSFITYCSFVCDFVSPFSNIFQFLCA